MANQHSIVHWYPDLEKHKCGYCKQLNTNCSYGMWAESLTVDDYQNLIDRGWRRSGKYCYKPVMDITCCPLYTIRCEALNLKLSKSQKKILKRVNKYISDSIQEKEHDNSEQNQDGMATDIIMMEKPTMKIDISKIDTSNLNLPRKVTPEKQILLPKTTKKENHAPNPDVHSKIINPSSIDLKNYKSGTGADLTKPPCKKAKLIRLERRQQKLAAKGIVSETAKSNANQGKTLEEFLTDISESPTHQLKICLVQTGGSSKDLPKTRSQEYPVYKKYQMIVHNDPPEKCSEKQFSSFLFESPLQIILKRMDTNESSFKESANLYAKYQIYVHNDPKNDCDVDTFLEFLVNSPIQHCSPPDGPPSGYGSFHQQYWLDDKLIAVGVIDILPKCVSSVYFFYDPDYRHLTLGTYGSLREVEFTRQLNQTVPDLKYYYMGFYIHSCPKMRYKANLTPSYLLCPETYDWFAIEKCVPMLEINPYSRFNEDIDAIDENACQAADIDMIMVLLNYRSCVPYKYFKTKVRGNEEEFIRFGNLVGKKCVPNLLLILRDSDFF